MRPNIALIGRARSGKDTVAAHLTAQPYNYYRLAFADALKAAALKADPIVSTQFSGGDAFALRLSRCVEIYGWERAKDVYPEVRGTLQRFGQSVRDLDEDFWLNIVLRKVDGAARLNIPVVVSDVRYGNEAFELRERGFTLVRLKRPGMEPAGAAHRSETELDDYPVDHTLINGGTVAELRAQVDDLVA